MAQKILIERLDELTEAQIKEAVSFLNGKEYADEVFQKTNGRQNKDLLKTVIDSQFPPKKQTIPLVPIQRQ